MEEVSYIAVHYALFNYHIQSLFLSSIEWYIIIYPLTSIARHSLSPWTRASYISLWVQ